MGSIAQSRTRFCWAQLTSDVQHKSVLGGVAAHADTVLGGIIRGRGWSVGLGGAAGGKRRW